MLIGAIFIPITSKSPAMAANNPSVPADPSNIASTFSHSSPRNEDANTVRGYGDLSSFSHADSDSSGSDSLTENALNYVALGDSRAAIPQTNQVSLTPCDRSRVSYPDLVAEDIHTSHETNVACVKATIANLFLPQHLGAFVAPPQIDALNSETQVVSISIGGNDIQWFRIVAPCFTAVYGQDGHCRTNARVAKEIKLRLANLRPSLALALQTIQARAPLAKIFVVGHGGYFGTKGCPQYVQSSPGDLRFIESFFHKFNSVLAQVSQANNATFVNIMSHTAGHDACQPPGIAWFSGTRSEDQTPPDHPTKAGSVAMASIVAAAIRHTLMKDHPTWLLGSTEQYHSSIPGYSVKSDPNESLLEPPSSAHMNGKSDAREKSEGIDLAGQRKDIWN